MRKRYFNRFILLVFCVQLVLAGCENLNGFDFSHLENIDCEGQWGLPLLNAQYTVEDILSMVDNPDLLQVADDGTLQIYYEYEVDSVVSASQYLDSYFNHPIVIPGEKTFNASSLPPISGDVQMLFMDTMKAEFPDNDIRISSATMKTGKVTITVNYDLQRPAHLVAYCPQLTDASGQMFRIEEYSMGDGFIQRTYDVSGFHMQVPSDNAVDVYLEVSCTVGGAALPDLLSFTYEVALSEISFTEIRGTFAPITLPVDEEWDFSMDFLREYVTGSITLLNPDLTCEIMNTFPVNGKIKVDEAKLSGPTGGSSIVAPNSDYFDVPASTTQFTPVPVPLASSITISPDYNHFKLSGTAIINPSGFSTQELVITENQLINLRFRIVLPIQLTMDNVMFHDTISFGGLTLPDQSAFTNLLVRLGVSNGIPLNFDLQAYFYDSPTNTIKDSLFMGSQTILGATGNTPRENELFVSKENFNEVQRMLSCDKIILKARVYTNGETVAINTNQRMGIHLSAKFNMDLNQLVNVGN